MKEVIHRINYFTAAFIGILGFSLAGEIFQEDDAPDKIDDVILLIIGIVAIWWYKKKGYKAPSVTGSLVLLVLALLTKIGAIIVEHADAEAVGDDIGIVIALVITIVFVLWQKFTLKKEK
jgi:hypothetical protein